MRFILALLGLLLALPAQAQVSQPFHLISAATNNATNIKPNSGTISAIFVGNTTTTLFFLKFYDLAIAPNCNTTTVVLSFAVPFAASNAGGGFTMTLPQEVQFKNGIGICLTGGIADNDNTAAATGVTIDVFFK